MQRICGRCHSRNGANGWKRFIARLPPWTVSISRRCSLLRAGRSCAPCAPIPRRAITPLPKGYDRSSAAIWIYEAGRPKGPWFKWKRDPHLVDAVLMYAQRGKGKRSGFYSDFHLRRLAQG